MATDLEQPPEARMVAKSVELKRADSLVPKEGSHSWGFIALLGLASGVAGTLANLGAGFLIRRFLRREAQNGTGESTKKIFKASGLRSPIR